MRETNHFVELRRTAANSALFFLKNFICLYVYIFFNALAVANARSRVRLVMQRSERETQIKKIRVSVTVNRERESWHVVKNYSDICWNRPRASVPPRRTGSFLFAPLLPPPSSRRAEVKIESVYTSRVPLSLRLLPRNTRLGTLNAHVRSFVALLLLFPIFYLY